VILECYMHFNIWGQNMTGNGACDIDRHMLIGDWMLHAVHALRVLW